MEQLLNKVRMEIKLSGKELTLAYQPRTEKCSWSIFDAGGVEIISGALSAALTHTIPLNMLSPNFYQLCVIDGADLLNSKFRIT